MEMMSTFEAQVLADLSVVKSQMASLLGDGQPGRLSLLEEHDQAIEDRIARLRAEQAQIRRKIQWYRSRSRRTRSR